MKELDYIRVVLIQPTHPGNIGATARAMANMGIRHLALVQPRDFPSPQATARAAGADYILENAMVVKQLDQAIADCALVVGASARLRTIEWPQLPPAEAMDEAVKAARHTPVAVLFGRESRGLTNRELDRCHYLVRIPANPEFPSLNIASAVMVLLYELRNAAARAAGDEAATEPQTTAEPRAVAEDMQHFYRHLERLLTLLEFGNGRSDKLHRKLTRLFNRAQPYTREIRILRGIFAAVERKIGR
ncbi:MAG: RNA methyltransferase [Gammaproteobacteria bacterium]|nr:RNA methyltransferase [Gammaproteobacteria bacterium]